MPLLFRSLSLVWYCLFAATLLAQPADCDDFRELYTPVQILSVNCDSIVLEAYPLGTPSLAWFVGDSLLTTTEERITFYGPTDALTVALVVEANDRCNTTFTDINIPGGCPKEDCANGLDDDGDGLVDLNDGEDCDCRPAPPIVDFNLFPNPGFEARRELPECTGCYAAGEAFPCVDGWVPGNSLTTIEHVLECFAIWVDSPFRPYSAATNNVSVIGGFAAYDSLGFATMESALVPLLEPTVPGDRYRLTFEADIGGGDILPLADDVVDEVLQNVAWYYSPVIDSFPYRFDSYEDRVSGGEWDNWTMLDSFFIEVNRNYSFNAFSVEFTAPPQPIRMMSFTGTLNQPRRYFFTDLVGDYEFYWVLDNVQLQRISPPEVSVADIDNSVTTAAIASTTADACAQGLSLSVSAPVAGDTYQWYREGVALPGATQSRLELPPDSLNGRSYQVRIIRGESCNTSFPRRAQPEPPFAASFAVDSIFCGGGATGGILAFVEPPEAVSAYLWEADDGSVLGNTGSVDGLVEGAYSLTLEDAFGCTYDYRFELLAPPPLAADISAEPIRCNTNDGNGTVNLDISGGVEPYEVLINGEAVSFTNRYRLPVGDYDFMVMDAEGCSISLPTVSLVEIAPFTLELELVNSLVRLGQTTEARLESNRELENAIFQWQPTEWMDCATCRDPIIQPTASDSIRVEVVDEDGCLRQAVVPITVVPDRSVYIPSAFSPNGDGINDLLRVYPGPGVGAVLSLEVYDRWGGLLYRGTGDAAAWDGRRQDGRLSIGTFVYAVRIAFLDGEVKTISGEVTLIR